MALLQRANSSRHSTRAGREPGGTPTAVEEEEEAATGLRFVFAFFVFLVISDIS
jgi:hypothetical protein